MKSNEKSRERKKGFFLQAWHKSCNYKTHKVKFKTVYIFPNIVNINVSLSGSKLYIGGAKKSKSKPKVDTMRHKHISTDFTLAYTCT